MCVYVNVCVLFLSDFSLEEISAVSSSLFAPAKEIQSIKEANAPFLIGKSLSCFIHFYFHKTVECYGERLRFLNLRMFFSPKDFL
jgi:hypothetical protein